MIYMNGLDECTNSVHWMSDKGGHRSAREAGVRPAVGGHSRRVKLVHAAVGEGHRGPTHVLDGDHADERDQVRPRHVGVRELDRLEARHR